MHLRLGTPLLAIVMLSGCGVAARPPSIPAPVIRETGFVTTGDGARIYYEAAGEGLALLFIHGLGGNHAAWFRQVPHFAKTRRAIVLAQRGFAPSTAMIGGYDATTLVADAIAVLETTRARDVVVVGQSMGGWTALGVALARPDLVRGVVLSGSIAGIFDAEIERHYTSVTERAGALAKQPPALGAHPAIAPGFRHEHPDEAYLYQLLTSFGAPRPGDVAEALGRARFSDEELATLRAPVLFVVGEHDSVFPPSIVRRAAARIPGAEIVEIANAGHSPYFERPREWNAAVDAFLR